MVTGEFAAPGYERVVQEFKRNFEEHGEAGAAFAAMHRGKLVVDLWAGRAHPDGRPWERDTIVPVFSGTKGVVAVCLLQLIEREQLDLDAPVAHYWPEFAANGKERITVAEAVSHRARLPVPREPVSFETVADADAMTALIAAQAPDDDPRAELLYHGVTWGTLAGELIRRADGRTVGRYLHEEIADPLGLDLWLGLPEELEPRVATLELSPAWEGFDPREHVAEGDAFRDRVFANPFWSLAGTPPEELPYNARSWHAGEIAGANAIGTARAFARLYGCLAQGGTLDGVQLLRPETLALGREPLALGQSPFGERLYAFGVGFSLQTAQQVFGPAREGFGHGGMGGSMHGAWPHLRTGFSYAMSEMRSDDATRPDPRAERLLGALHEVVGAA